MTPWRFTTLLVAVVLWGITGAGAQTFTVTAGEHPTFTRLVINAQPGIQWELATDGMQRRLIVAPASTQFDVSRVFARIPRTRLSTAQAQPGVLILSLPCDCVTRAWEDRPGLIVIDISDAPPPITVPLTPAETAAPSAAYPPLQILDTARAAGLSVAQAHVEELQRSLAAQPRPPAGAPEAMAQSLGLPIARALSQGLLEPAASGTSDTQALLLGDGARMTDLPDNMRIETVIDRPAPDAAPQPESSESCQGSEALGFLLTHSDAPFGQIFGELTRALYGEFDQPDPEARRALIELYLGKGFGAESRALITNEPDPVTGRDALLGMSDVLEGRNSNSRMRLAQMITCPGPAAVLAAMAGAPAPQIARAASQIALTFTEFDAPMRAILGQDLAQNLIDAGAVDAARIVAGSTQRSAWASPESLTILEALLDRARGHPADALARLDHEGTPDTPSLQTRLDLALETGNVPSNAVLADAEALASTERNSEIGTNLMVSIIRLYAQSGAFDPGFAALDRLAAWGLRTSEADHQHDQLRNLLWASVAQTASDLSVMRNILNRDDWRVPPLNLEARQALAQRLLDLGLGEQVIALFPREEDGASALLMARAHLASGHPDAAIEALGNLSTDESRTVRAQALAALGDNSNAAQEFAAMDQQPAARTAAILAGDWAQLQHLSEGSSAQTPLIPENMGRILGHAPGHLQRAPMPTHGSAVEGPTPDQNVETAGQAPAGAAPASAVNGTVADETSTRPLVPQDNAVSDGVAPTTEPAASNPLVDFDRLGLITRSATLLTESERLREALSPLLQSPTTPQPLPPPGG